MFERIVIRAIALGLSSFVTLSIVAALANTADMQHAQACQAYAKGNGSTQQVMVIGQRPARS
ncbi:MAG TPA: hypothetical protein VMT83_02320 [Burkholderiaceae bacterium]|nr:hypothetical protein [Burkholderiaceae bacterium]